MGSATTTSQQSTLCFTPPAKHFPSRLRRRAELCKQLAQGNRGPPRPASDMPPATRSNGTNQRLETTPSLALTMHIQTFHFNSNHDLQFTSHHSTLTTLIESVLPPSTRIPAFMMLQPPKPRSITTAERQTAKMRIHSNALNLPTLHKDHGSLNQSLGRKRFS